MTTTKRKKAEEGYSYYEYLRKFRPKSVRDEEGRNERSDELTKLALNKVRKGLNTSSRRASQK
ncbi:MAG: hypothetical protein WCF57_04330 [Pyrinomonadaceae bacterium]